MQEYANRKEGVANHYSMKEECLGNRWKEKVENYGMMHIDARIKTVSVKCES